MTHQDPHDTRPHDHPSHLDNPHTKEHLDHSQKHVAEVHHSTDVEHHLKDDHDRFRQDHFEHLRARWESCHKDHDDEHYRYWYSGWYAYGFCGGYYYPVREWWEIEEYFYYPVIYWWYVDIDPVIGDPYYVDWFYPAPPVCPFTTFEFARAYFPTDSFRDLGMDVSALDSATQCNFRAAMINTTRSLRDQISDIVGASITFGSFDIVVNHFSNLGSGYVLEGFVDRPDLQVSFKTILDLTNPDQSLVFLPTTQDPNPTDLARLNILNDKVRAMGGDPTVVDLEPEK